METDASLLGPGGHRRPALPRRPPAGRPAEASLALASGLGRTGAAEPRALASPSASLGSLPRPHAPTVAGPHGCTVNCSTDGRGRTGCKGKTSGGTVAGRTSGTAVTPALPTLHAIPWRHAASRATSRPPRTSRSRARRARWASQLLLGGPSSSRASLSALFRDSPQPANRFSVSSPDPTSNQVSLPAHLELGAGRITTTTIVITAAINSTSIQISADLGDRQHC